MYPTKCVNCKKRLMPEYDLPLCPDCLSIWERELNSLCPTCDQPIPQCWCGIYDDCENIIEREIHLVPYFKDRDTVGKKMILRCKYKNDELTFDFLAKALAPKISEFPQENTVLCPVPRSKYNFKKIGHDQTLELCKRISKITEIEICRFIENHGAEEQKKLTYKQRRKNAVRNYKVEKDSKNLIKGKNVILFDDLVTSGATVTRCAVLLKRYYANRVFVLTIGKTAR